MKIALIALGSRGDVQPYVALGVGLQRAGHAVRIVTHENFAGLVQGHGLDFYPMRGNVQEVAESETMRKLLAEGNFLKISAYTAKEAERASLLWAEDGLQGCQGVDLISGGIGGLFIGLALAEKLGVPFMQTHLVPFTPTSAFPGILLPADIPLPGAFLTRLSHHLIRQIMWQGARAGDRAARQMLGLATAPFQGPYKSPILKKLPVLYGYSPSLLPRPADWGKDQHVTGFWFLDAAATWTPPAALVDFLEAGKKPVAIGFGSMSNRDPQQTIDLILQALDRSGQRAVILSGWSGMQGVQLPETVLMLDAAPHDWLFPRMAAVVHHGGIGTTAAGLRAGVPATIIPFFADQPFWGKQLARAGVGTEPVPRKKLSVERLTAALRQLGGDQQMQQRAAEIGKRIRAEDGVGRAVEIINREAFSR